MGKGNFIIEHAKRNLNINYIGFEKYESVILQALVKLEELEYLVEEFADNNDVDIEIDYAGTLEIMDKINNGDKYVRKDS